MEEIDENKEEEQEEKPKSKKHRKDKPWDSEDIDHWKIDSFKPGEMRGPLTEESSFATLFPKYREKYLREVWPQVVKIFKEHAIDATLNLIEGSMTVKTTRKTWDPFIIIKARDMIKLLARSVPLQQAAKVLQDDTACDIIKISGMVSNPERFIKRRARLIGPEGSTLKAIELLTGCYVLIQGNTVSATGPYKGLKQVRKIVEDCMNNVHPIYNIKILMIKRELAKDPALTNENWDRFLPKFKRQNIKKKKQGFMEKDTEKSPFPPPQTPSKIDLQLESGEYFLSEQQKQKKKKTTKRIQSSQKTAEKRAKREREFEPPEEPETKHRKVEEPTVAELSNKIKEKTKKTKKVNFSEG